MSKNYETVIGLEVHVELATKTKIFCSCSTEFGGKPNTHTCPVCTGMPGSLPVLNKQVVEYAMAVGLATNCSITRYSKFDRKNYFYPDNPQNYQISQLYLPICRNGYVEIETPAGKKKWVRVSSGILCVSIILATVFIKQHSVFDMLTAFVMAVAMYGIVYHYDVLIYLKQHRTARRAAKTARNEAK